MKLLLSTSASTTKSLRGAKAYIAVSKIKVEDDTHESDVKRGEKFYLKQNGKNLYFIDVEQEGGKDILYQYKIDRKLYVALKAKHRALDEENPTKAVRLPRNPDDGHKVTTKTIQDPATIKVLKDAFKSSGVSVTVKANPKTDGTVVSFKDSKPDMSSLMKTLERVSGSVSGTVYVQTQTGLARGTALPKFTVHLMPKKPNVELSLGEVFKMTRKGIERQTARAKTTKGRVPKSTDTTYDYTGSTKAVAKKTAAYLKESSASILPALNSDNLKEVIADLNTAARTGDAGYLHQAMSELESNFKASYYVIDQNGKGEAFVIRQKVRG